jgi:hypothetical protein
MDIGNELLDNAIKGEVQLDPTDSDYTHLMTKQRKKIGNIEVVDLPVTKRKGVPERIIFARSEKRSRTPEKKRQENGGNTVTVMKIALENKSPE